MDFEWDFNHLAPIKTNFKVSRKAILKVFAVHRKNLRVKSEIELAIDNDLQIMNNSFSVLL